MFKASVAGFLGLCAASALGSTPAAAWGWGDCCDCYPYYGYGPYAAARVYGYAYEPRVAYYGYDPRWQYSAAYYAHPPARVYGYAHVDRGPAYLVRPVGPRGWHRRW